MTSVQTADVVEVDPFDAPAFDAWYDVYLAAEVFGREELAAPWLREEARAEQQAGTSAHWTAVYALREGDQVVAAGRLELPLQDNLALALVGVHVHPAHRRRGLGRRLLAHLEAVARARGRSILITEAPYPYAGPEDGRGTPGVEFALAQGFELALVDVLRHLPLPVAESELDRLAALAAPHHAAYTLRSFVGRVPDELAQGFTEVGALVDTEAPTGDLELEEATASVPVLREFEVLLGRQQRTRYATVAVAPDGQVAAYTDIMVPEPDPATAFQWGTLVRREHRGRRLGLAVKVANLRLLQDARDDVRRVATHNASTNAPMVAVNEVMGFRPAERLGEVQKRLG